MKLGPEAFDISLLLIHLRIPILWLWIAPDYQLLRMQGLLEVGFSRITTLWNTLLQVLSYQD